MSRAKVAVAVALLVLACCGSVVVAVKALQHNGGRSDEQHWLISMEIAFDDVSSTSAVGRRLSGSLDVPQILAEAAACSNGPDWLGDVTLDTSVVVSTRPDLVRAAELYESGKYDSSLVQDVERQLWNGVNEPDIAHALADQHDIDDVAAYLVDRTQMPGDDAQSRFVAYAAAKNLLGDGYLRVVDLHRLDVAAIRAFANESTYAQMFVAGSTADPREIPASACLDVVSGNPEQPGASPSSESAGQ